MRDRWAARVAMELRWSFGGSGIIGADAMVRGHFPILCSDSYVVNFASYLVVVVTSLRKLWTASQFVHYKTSENHGRVCQQRYLKVTSNHVVGYIDGAVGE